MCVPQVEFVILLSCKLFGCMTVLWIHTMREDGQQTRYNGSIKSLCELRVQWPVHWTFIMKGSLWSLFHRIEHQHLTDDRLCRSTVCKWPPRSMWFHVASTSVLRKEMWVKLLWCVCLWIVWLLWSRHTLKVQQLDNLLIKQHFFLKAYSIWPRT